ncbi:MAG: hypothetical protein JRM80_05575 [Nitrososphaerota archaeon]|nr:hypothetical protein [Nitrososphaerota archaeon]
MTDAVDPKSRRELITKLLPYVAISAVRMGLTGSPLTVLTSAATKYNEEAEKTKGMVKDLLPLLPGFEKLQITAVGSNAVSLVMQRQDLVSCAEVYLSKVFKFEGSDSAPSGVPKGEGGEAQFDYLLRLPFKSVYLKVVEELGETEVSSLLGFARGANPAEVWVVADAGRSVDQRLDPVFVSESKILRGRVKSVTTAEMLREFFGGRFAVTLEKPDRGSLKVTLRLAA